MFNFDTLIVSGSKDTRGVTQGLLHLATHDDPNVLETSIKLAANPAQAEAYFTEHRNEARNLLLIADEDMTGGGYRGTSYEEPNSVPNERQNFQALKQRAQQWCEETGSRCFLVHRSDAPSTSIECIEQAELNNFDNYIEVFKDEETYARLGSFDAILKHCNKLFALPVN